LSRLTRTFSHDSTGVRQTSRRNRDYVAQAKSCQLTSPIVRCVGIAGIPLSGRDSRDLAPPDLGFDFRVFGASPAIARRRRTWLNVFLCGSLRTLREKSRFPLLGWSSGVSPSGKLWQVIKPGSCTLIRIVTSCTLVHPCA
jgi:hypothetical protein